MMSESKFQVIASGLLDAPQCEDIIDFIRDYEVEDEKKVRVFLISLEYPRYGNIWKATMILTVDTMRCSAYWLKPH